jgi:hypothetical protein
MDDRTLYETILGLEEPWCVEAVEIGRTEIRVRLELRGEGKLECPECSEVAPGYDRAPERQWRHLDT